VTVVVASIIALTLANGNTAYTNQAIDPYFHTIILFSGPSGCGKTTLLKCIVGKLKLVSVL
jgi:ABC-type Fe3+/spermidine/putrescine transport system ATPase subunit